MQLQYKKKPKHMHLKSYVAQFKKVLKHNHLQPIICS